MMARFDANFGLTVSSKAGLHGTLQIQDTQPYIPVPLVRNLVRNSKQCTVYEYLLVTYYCSRSKRNKTAGDPTFSGVSPRPVFLKRYHMKRCEDSGLWVPGPGGSVSVEGEDEDAYDEEVTQDVHVKAGQAGGESTTEGRVLHQSPPPAGDGSADTD